MIKASAVGKNGKKLVVLGLSFRNLEEFRKKPRDTFIKVPEGELDVGVEIVIFSCETEEHGMEVIKDFINEETKVTVSEKLKQ